MGKSVFDPKTEICDKKKIMVTTKDGHQMDVFITTPKSIASLTKRPAYMYAHGGGVFAGTAT